jgi:hypothetical protein
VLCSIGPLEYWSARLFIDDDLTSAKLPSNCGGSRRCLSLYTQRLNGKQDRPASVIDDTWKLAPRMKLAE